MTGIIGSLTGANAAKKASDQAAAAQAAETARENNITAAAGKVNDTFNAQFAPGFYDQQRQNYLNYATPQLQQQYADAQKQLTYSLARAGNLDSSARSQQEGDLQKQYDANQQQLQSSAQAAANTIKSNVESSRSGLIASLNTSGDTAAAVNNAASQAAALSQTPSYSPLGDLFSTTTSALAQQAALDKQNALASGSSYTSPFAQGLNRAISAVKVSP